MKIVMKKLASTLFRQRGIQYEFGPEYMAYSVKRAAGIEVTSHLRLLSELFTPEQFDDIPIDNKVGENYFGESSNQLRRKGRPAFKAIGQRLVINSSADLAFRQGAEEMLKEKQLKMKKKQVDEIEAE
jgi:hypothetical protein